MFSWFRLSRPSEVPATPPPPPGLRQAAARVIVPDDDPPVGVRFGGRVLGCGHSCKLTTSRCCVCMDQRPHAAFYDTYIDGVGFRKRATREAGYCMECQVAWRTKERPGSGAAAKASSRGTPTAKTPGGSPAAAAAAAAPRGRATAAAAAPAPHGGAAAAAAAPSRARVAAAAAPSWRPEPVDDVSVEDFRNLQGKGCGHICALSFTTVCCACADARPFSPDGRYLGYIDGRGDVREFPRHQHYCRHCKASCARGWRAGGPDGTARPAETVAPMLRKTCGHTCATAGRRRCCACDDDRVAGPDGLIYTIAEGSGRGLVGEPRCATYCIRCQTREEADAGTAVAATRTVPPSAPPADALPPPAGRPTLTREISLVSTEACPLCGHNKLFRVAGFQYDAMCTYCSSVFPKESFPGSFLSSLPELDEDRAARVAARVTQLAREASSLRIARQRSGDALRTLAVSLAAEAGNPTEESTDAGEPTTVEDAASVRAVGAAEPDAPSSGAAATPAPTMNVRDVLAQLCCTICLEPYVEPVTLPSCGHSFCRACIHQVAGSNAGAAAASAAARRRGKCVACPVCRTVSMDVETVAISTELAFAMRALVELARLQGPVV